jgi:DNA repair protein RadC
MLIDHSNFKTIIANKPDKVYEVLLSIRQNLEPFEFDKEYFYVFGLTRRNTIRYIDLVSIGSMTGTVAEPREIFRMAIHKAVGGGIVIAHNHPSGNLNPSQADIRLTQKIRESGNIIGIKLIDHIIFSDEGFYSFANEGTL